MQVVDLPYELVVQIASNLDPQDIRSFILSSRKFHQYSLWDSFWSDLCRCNHIQYVHPDTDYKSLFLSGELDNMCHHVQHSFMSKHIPWDQFNQQNIASLVYCFHCEFIGTEEEYEKCHQDKIHAVVLRSSMLHVLELWCNSCRKAIGFDGFEKYNQDKLGLKSEKYMMHEITRSLTQPINDHVVKARRMVEYQLFQTQFRFTASHIVDKQWYTSWLDFISGKSNELPGSLSNRHLYRSDNTLDPTLVLGEDFELVSSLTRWYVERIYGIQDIISSTNELPIHDAEYCRLLHKIKIRHQMNQFTRYPPTLITAVDN